MRCSLQLTTGFLWIHYFYSLKLDDDRKGDLATLHTFTVTSTSLVKECAAHVSNAPIVQHDTLTRFSKLAGDLYVKYRLLLD